MAKKNISLQNSLGGNWLMKTFIGLRADKDYVKKNGNNRIYLLIGLGREFFELPIFLEWKAGLVDEANNTLRERFKKDDLCADYNLIIREDFARANKIFVEFRLARKPLTKEEFVKRFNDSSNGDDFPNFMKLKINYRYSRGKIAEGTRKSHVNSYLWLVGYKPKVSFNELTPNFIERFEQWLYKQQNKRSKSGAKLNGNTISNILKYIKAYISLAIKDKVCTIDHPFAESDVKVTQDEKPVQHLRPEHVATLMDYYESKLPLGKKLTLCRFLIACHLSLRISDILKINREKVEYYDYTRKMIFHPKKQQRTKKLKTVFVPINDTTLRYLNDVVELQSMALREGKRISEVMGRKFLKQIAKELDLYLSGFHTGRHTFATNYIRAGGKVTNLQHIMGHSSISTTMKYVHIVEEDKDEEMTQLSNFYETRRTLKLEK